MGKEKGGRQFLTKIIIIRYLYASVIRSVKFRDNEVSLASQRRNTSHFRTSPSVTRSKLPPLDGEKPISRFFFLTGIRCFPEKFTSLCSRGEIHLFRKKFWGKFLKEQLAVSRYSPETLRILTLGFLVLAILIVTVIR